ncbi:sensor histidine kinase [Calycomorphotria hydatis]|uniref:histidine kinase n=1 Tax=Calycomorphotria hydatis TaxID=2528027 RepID=A0A517T431_9PLAN|nr:ATP-binding protein [Calycomorphotria hydatis]QDT63111.1 Sensor protein ZraS [Calycomorphotria hydatis]
MTVASSNSVRIEDDPLAADHLNTDALQAKYKELAALAGGLAHEIRNPLSTIGLNLELMAEDLDPPQSPRDRRLLTKLENVRKECDHLDEILKAFLQYTKAGQPALDEGDVNQAIRDFIDFFQHRAAAAGVELRDHLRTDLPAVKLDETLFRQVLMNLGLNAVQAMEAGGVLEFMTDQDSDEVTIRIIDNGPGIDEQTRERMFDAFYSTRPGGHGLGLPTVKRIIEAHCGTIYCESDPGMGTRFTIRLPIDA